MAKFLDLEERTAQAGKFRVATMKDGVEVAIVDIKDLGEALDLVQNLHQLFSFNCRVYNELAFTVSSAY